MGRTAIIFVSCVLVGSLPTATRANISEEAAAIIAALQEQVQTLVTRVESLESNQTKIRTETLKTPKITSTAPAPASWTDDFKVKGDFRYRHEAFDIENRRDRHRQRMRARVKATGKVTDTVEAGFGLATGGSDPISTNQTFDGASSSKSVVIDLAYAKWRPNDEVSVVAGKFKNPIHRAGGNGLLWDGDLNPEGVGVQYQSGKLFVNGIASWVDESSGGSDTILIGGQLGVDKNAGDGNLKLGVGYFNYLDSEGEIPFFDGSASGNLLDGMGRYENGYELVEGFAEYAVGLGDGKLTVFADYVQNLNASDYDTGFAFGGKYKQSNWQFGYTYQELEADAVLATFTDSDFIGGGTDGEGHILQTSYAINKQISLKGTLFLNDRNIDFGNEEEFKRLMLDISFKY